MVRWKCIRLGDVCDVRDGTHDSPKYVSEGYPLITSKNLSSGFIDISEVNYITQQDYDKINSRSKVDNGDILMPMIGTIGSPIIVAKTFDFAIKNVALIKFNKESVLNKFILFILSSRIFIEYVERENKGGTQKFISLGSIRNFEFPLPPLEVQRKIAETLDAASELLAMRKNQLAELDQLVKSQFIEMFGNPLSVLSKWKTKQLKELSISISDGSNIDKSLYQEKGEVLFLRIQNVWFNEFRVDDSVYVSKDVNNDYFDTSLHHGDLLITKIGRFYTKDSSLGRVSVYLGENDKANYSNNIMRVRLKEDVVLSEFVNALMNLDEYNKYIRKSSVGGTDKRALSKALIGSLPVIFPPIELQSQFVEFIHQLDKSRFIVQKAIDETQALFDSLMNEYFE